ncbi:MAG TPA: G/U mismatch-specific DNA glycosylase [Tepidisphaeraceae bacterium]|nr:G/U mismatch-specific DNA glycosylase [Tepidisphaeraceae bacterium]
MPEWKPTREQIRAAHDKTIRDVIAPDLRVLFCGINPGLYTAAVGHHFARPGNRFWPALHCSGFTPRLYSPFEEEKLLELGLGITNIVRHATNRADELTDQQVRTGGRTLVRKIRRYRPCFAAVVGLGAYRVAFNDPGAKLGLQVRRIGSTRLWVLPNPSGLNAHYTPRRFAEVFEELRRAADNVRNH